MNPLSMKAATDDVVASQPVSAESVKLPYTATTPNLWSYDRPTFRFGVADAKGPRRAMEDAHSFVFDYAGLHGQGFFAVFDGHAGKEAADWCGNNFHKYLHEALKANPEANIPDVYNQTFHNVDRSLSRIAEESGGKIHSGTTAVTAFLRIEDREGGQSFAASIPQPHANESDEAESADASGANEEVVNDTASKGSPDSPPQAPPPGAPLRRMLYVANAGDARGVLCRGGKALRLTYDHKGTDKQEAKRITDSGGFVMSGRVNGVLAVTRSLGDSSMKEFVVGAPYTTETEVTEDDEFLILACDGIWDVLDDLTACRLVRGIQDSQEAAKALIHEATLRYTNDNITVMVIRLKDVTPEVKAAAEATK
ncbi:protein serine/threonine phosphatase 2C [Auriscalpium vulgare]|uniref:Protein serine/threonine phosphatase 2C n=1 Tax=Auriscalpium vulgare TaxID=40419 RepID=A0ACB8S6E7_9AGAM|nr:protein serine/threonine phosphatase 2C [Auriscalpium vulgare]